MDYDKVLKSVKDITKKYGQFISKKNYKDLSEEQFKEAMAKEHDYLFTNNIIIFNKAVAGELDLTVFSYMINKAKDIKKNKISNFDADKDVGQKLVDTFIKPHIDKIKK